MTAVLLGDLNMLRCFAGSTIPFVVATPGQDRPLLASRYAREQYTIAPFTEPTRAVSDLERLGEVLDRPVLFYGDDRQLLAISRHRAHLSHFRFAMPSAEIVEKLVDKGAFAQWAAALGLPVPRTYTFADARLPCVVKPIHHIGWRDHRKALVANTREQLLAHRELLGGREAIVQEYIRGGEENVYSYHAYVDRRGRVLGEFVGRKIRTYPRSAGVSTYLELVKDPEVMAIGRRAIEALSLVGPMKIDMKRDDVSGTMAILEVNARFNLWHHLGAAAGINLPQIAYRDLVGEDMPKAAVDYATDIRWLAFGDDVRTFLRSYRSAGLSWIDWLTSLAKGRHVFDVFDWSDPMPWASTIVGRLARGAS